MSGRAAATPARRAAFEVLRRVFEHDAWADRAFPAAADRHDLDGRERAQAQRLAFGAVQRRGTSDALDRRELADRTLETLDPPVLAALRLGLFELLFSDAGRSTPRSTPRSSWRRAGCDAAAARRRAAAAW